MAAVVIECPICRRTLTKTNSGTQCPSCGRTCCDTCVPDEGTECPQCRPKQSWDGRDFLPRPAISELESAARLCGALSQFNALIKYIEELERNVVL